jgi:hypothetical protein
LGVPVLSGLPFRLSTQKLLLNLVSLSSVNKMPKPKPKPKAKPKTKAPQEAVDKTTLNFLAIMGILGLILIVAGVASIFLASAIVGVGLIVAGVIVYVLFAVIEKRLKVI